MLDLCFRVATHSYGNLLDDLEARPAEPIDDDNTGKNTMSRIRKRAQNLFGVVNTVRLTDLLPTQENHRVAADDDAFRIVAGHRLRFAKRKVQHLLRN
jgi:hypothetical protein